MHALTSLAAVRFTGNDVRIFLQGQLSNDLQLLTPERSLLASCNSAQGRVQAILTLIERGDGIVALLPAAMVEITIARLRKYILRSKVVIEGAQEQLQLFAATRAELELQQLPLPQQAGAHWERLSTSVLRWRDPQERFLVIRPRALVGDIPAARRAGSDPDQDWHLAEIRAGLPQVFPETHESFVAQMLNLDTLGGISFEKGCYTGQEIIARAHFRGAVKRRMFRLSADGSPPPAGTRIFAEGTHAGEVVMAAAVGTGCELLAVLHLTHRQQPLELESRPGVVLTPQQLPYALPLSE